MKNNVLLPVALLVGVALGWANLHTDETLFVAELVAIAAFGLTWAGPRRAWLWALMMGASVPLSYLVTAVLGSAVRFPVEPNGWASLIAFIPAAVGAYAGLALCYFTRPAK